MELIALVVIGGLVVVSTALGLLHRALNGRVHRVSSRGVVKADVVRAKDLGTEALGSKATLLQFSTEVCAPCRTTNRVLKVLASEHFTVKHIDLDLTHRPDLAARFSVLQTPTTLILDRKGVVRARIGGAPRRDALTHELERILAA